jgi:hypothetical protein
MSKVTTRDGRRPASGDGPDPGPSWRVTVRYCLIAAAGQLGQRAEAIASLVTRR